MAKNLSYIGHVDTDSAGVYRVYTTSPDGQQYDPTNPTAVGDYQGLTVNSTVIQPAVINPDISLAEDAPYRKYESTNHNYYKIQHSGSIYSLVVDTSAPATALPQYLTGWQTYNGTSFDSEGQTFDATIISRYFGEGTNLDLYAVWGNTRLLRVIIFYQGQTTQINNLQYTVDIEQTDSYSGTYGLSNQFKSIVDKSNMSNHLLSIDSTNYPEYGTGDASLKLGTQYPTYFGIKTGSTPTTFTISYTGSALGTPSDLKIPSYTYVSGVLHYYGFVCPSGLSREFDDKLYSYTHSPDYVVEMAPVSGQTMVWNVSTSKFTNMSTDKTLFVPLVDKPVITAYAVNGPTAGKVNIDDSDPTHGLTYAQKIYMPDDTAILYAFPAPGYSFDGWYDAQTGGNLLSNNLTYTVTVQSNYDYYARFQTAGYTITYYKNRNTPT